MGTKTRKSKGGNPPSGRTHLNNVDIVLYHVYALLDNYEKENKKYIEKYNMEHEELNTKLKKSLDKLAEKYSTKR